MNTNRYGLSRNIPSEVKREIRQRSGFGCVICGLGITEYEHIDPEFHKARAHDPLKMTLLCPNCHTKVTHGFLSKKRVTAAMADPICLRQGYANEEFDFMNMYPTIILGDVTFIGIQTPIRIRGVNIFSVEDPEMQGGPFRLSARFTDSKGANSLNIVKNEWQAMSSNWDIVVENQSITVREAKRHIHLKMTYQEPNILKVSKLHMVHDGIEFKVEEDGFYIIPEDGKTASFHNFTVRTDPSTYKVTGFNVI